MFRNREREQRSSFGRAAHVMVAMLLTCMAFLLYIMSVHAANDDEFDLDATGRVSGNGDTAVVVVTVTNYGSDFGGYIRLSVNDKYNRDDHQSAYECFVAVGEDETENVTLTFPIVEGLSLEDATIELQILDEKKSVLQIKKMYHLFDADASIHIGLLCDEPSALDYLTNQSMFYSPYIYNYGSDSESWESEPLMGSELLDEFVMNRMSILVIDDFNAASLGKEQIQAIEEWVKDGGILLIGTGENLDETFSAFDADFIEASLGDTKTYEDYSYYSNAGYMTFADISYGKSYLQGMGRDAQTKKIGRGGIILTQFALTDPDIDGSYFVNDLHTTVSGFFGNSVVKRNTFSNQELTNLFGVMQGKAKLNGGLLSAIIVIYVILVGPVLYLILKKYDKREKYWYAVPAMSFVFVVIIFMASRGFTVKNRMFETIRVVKADGTGQESDYIFGFSSNQKPWTLNLDNDIVGAGPISQMNNYSDNSEDQYRYTATRSPKGMQLQYRPGGVFENAYFKCIQPAQEELGELNFDLELKRSGIQGYVENNTDYDFECVLVVCDGYYQVISDLESGDKYSMSGYGRTSYKGESDIRQQACSLYNKEDYRNAKIYAALAMAAHEIQGEARFVIGITSTKDKMLQGIGNNEEAFLCIYETE